MPKINTIVKIEKKKILDLNADIPYVNAYARHKERATGYNAGQEDYGNKSVGLDVEEIYRIMINQWPKKIVLTETIKHNYRVLAQALKDKEDKIIVEVKG